MKLRLGLLALLLPGAALADGAAVADAVLVPRDTLVQGTANGPEEAQAIWTGLGGIRPFAGSAMAVFSTGALERPPIPGTDIGVVGLAGERSVQLSFALRPPPWAQSLRFAYAVVAPMEYDPEVAHTVEGDTCEVTLSGVETFGTDPWTRTPVGPISAGLEQTDGAELADVPWLAGAGWSGWIEYIVPVRPAQGDFTFSFSPEEGNDSALGDIVCLLDGVEFDRGIPVGVGPGFIPKLDGVLPAVVPPNRASSIVLLGRDLPADDVAFTLLDDDGIVEAVLEPEPLGRSAERVELPLPSLPAGLRGVRVTWPGGAMTWPAAFEVRTVPPRIESVAPAVGPPEGGNRIALRGTGFHDVDTVVVGDRVVPPGDIVTVSSELVEVLVPPAAKAVGAVDVRLTAGGLITTAPNAYTIAATEEQIADSEDPGPPGPSTACSTAGGATPGWVLLSGLLLRRRARRPEGQGPGRQPS